ncbi:Monoglyceride lipase (MGL) (Monoacylglycerol lipase) (MAGL) [Durusdinium trenchii]|uniref:Monoglyceride lipase (MGL) (Monoacylglycerol lipase) (MAGL) n=1 Tax=Durusdinium trenchii TaxID=1381693 RepID=A0ABP0QFW3_9DINO
MGGCCGRTLPPHQAIMYEQDKPPVAEDGHCSDAVVFLGEFNRSFDRRLWLYTRSWEPQDKSKVWATMMIVHGTVDHSGVYAELGAALAQHGVAVFASDMRGWGRSDGERLYVDSIDSFAGDILADYHRIHGPGASYAHVRSRFLLGKSIGGLFTAWTAAMPSARQLWTGLIGLSGAFQIDSAVKPSLLRQLLLPLLGLLVPKRPLKPPFDPKLIVSDAAALKAWEEDPLVSRGKLTPGYILEMLRLQDELPTHLNGLTLPVLMLWGTGDQVVTEAGHELLMASTRPHAVGAFAVRALSGWLSQFVGGTQIERQRDEGHRQLDSQSGQVDLTHSVLELHRGVGIE